MNTLNVPCIKATNGYELLTVNFTLLRKRVVTAEHVNRLPTGPESIGSNLTVTGLNTVTS